MKSIVTIEGDNWVYIRLPKCGSSSMYRILSPYTWSYYTFDTLPDYKDKYVFTIVRNPYHRAVSAWRNRIVMRKKIENRELLRTTFPQYVSKIADIEDEYADEHIQSQTFILNHVKNHVRLFKLEEFGEALEYLETNVVKRALTMHHEKKSNIADYMSLYNEDMKKIIQQRYKNDFMKFQYAT